MKSLITKWQTLPLLLLAAMAAASCDMMEQDTSDCPYGLYVTFKYDYNLQRADMFNDHVGSVTLYVFDEDGRLVKTQEESNRPGAAPLASPAYTMHIADLAPGRYRMIALAGQRPYADMQGTGRAVFTRSHLAPGDGMAALDIRLDCERRGEGLYEVVNNALPLDTLWHGMTSEPVEVFARHSNRPSYDTISLVRDTKKINVALRELDDPTTMDIADYDLRITDRNAHILWDNSLDETDTVVYTPHDTWNTGDRTGTVGSGGSPLDGIVRIGHADFMTSRILYHDNNADDGRLTITNRLTGVRVADVNLPDLLSRLRTSEDRYLYSEQEFLDRGYDYQVTFFLRGGKLDYISIAISALGWSKRIQFEQL